MESDSSYQFKTYSQRIYEDLLPKYLSIGVPYERFMESCPNELKPFWDAYELKMIRQDQLMHLNGLYIMSAVSKAIDMNINGKKSKSKYIEKPIIEELIRKSKMTREEIEQEELRKMIEAEDKWILSLRSSGKPETKIK